MSVHDITRVISFTSGKGGVGKTSIISNVAIALARQGQSVLVLDADLGLANVDVLLGLEVRRNLNDVLQGRAELEEVMIDGPSGISVIPAASGVESISSLSAGQRLILFQAVENVAYDFDYLLIDTSAGIGSNVMHFNSASGEVVCVVTPDPTSLTDAYALIKILSRNYGEKSISVVTNQVRSESEGMRTYNKLAKAVEQFLQVELRYLGHVPKDESMVAAITDQRAVLELYPTSASGLAINRLAKTLDNQYDDFRIKGGMQFFFKQILEINAHGC